MIIRTENSIFDLHLSYNLQLRKKRLRKLKVLFETMLKQSSCCLSYVLFRSVASLLVLINVKFPKRF